MSLHLEMLQVARLSPRLLGDSAARVAAFASAQLTPAGGFPDRNGKPDLYYTLFGVGCLQAVQAPVPLDRIGAWIRRHAVTAPRDLVHAASLARCAATLGRDDLPALARRALLRVVASHRAADGGYHHAETGAAHGTPYGCFLALGALQDLAEPVPEPARVVASVLRLTARDGGFANAPGLPLGSTPATAASVAVLRALGAPAPEGAAAFLLARRYGAGGFFAAPGAPAPDLLSTAVALHALAGLEVPLEGWSEPMLDFVDSLWSADGGFYGHWADDALDCEYTFYGLLALGHLSLA